MSRFLNMSPHTSRAPQVKYVSQWADKIVTNTDDLSDVSWYEKGYPYSRADERIETFFNVPGEPIVNEQGDALLTEDGERYIVGF